MSIKPHLIEDEEVLSHCVTDQWAWICTDQRLIKYRKSNSGVESLSDVSYSEISGISLTNESKDASLLIGAVASGTLGLLIAITAEVITLIIGGVLLLLSVGLTWLWMNSEKSYFELKGTGPIRQEPVEWRIQKSASSKNDVREFVKTLRSQL